MRTVKIPEWMKPFKITINGVSYTYPAGETVEVEDFIAEAIEGAKFDPPVAPNNPSSGGVSSWNDLTDKPFGKIGGDTLTWDGNTEGLAAATIEVAGELSIVAYKVSDAVPTKEDLKNGVTITTNEGTTAPIPPEEILEAFGKDGSCFCSVFLLVPVDNYEEDTENYKLTFPQAGIYYSPPDMMDGLFWASLTIPGYTGFSTIKTIEQKYLPKALQFGESETGGDTLTWDGNTAGLLRVGDSYYKISDAVPSFEDMSNGGFATAKDKGTFGSASIEGMWSKLPNGGWELLEGFMICVTEAGETFDNLEFTESGIYAMREVDDTNTPISYIMSLQIEGYTGFPGIKKVEEKYLPNGVEWINVTADDQGNFVSDKTYEEIYASFVAGKLLAVKTFSNVLYMSGMVEGGFSFFSMLGTPYVTLLTVSIYMGGEVEMHEYTLVRG